MIAAYEIENKDLKDKIVKLEYHINMLSKSHMELEYNIIYKETLFMETIKHYKVRLKIRNINITICLEN
jgi:hypothetical protein